ncbi:branched-chain amino acid ABC transporter permease [Enteractinococcus helveticum]|uniref:Branched-chain amino acid ABC transporter permease n=2 Tax=Enteractinococcus helveticum TaxID=1837282 RepID=A0A1B7LUI8_9MICC|nr:branched-chain amino acid ABC transporter permease [Enteractinococcus helveticum]
MTVIVLAVIAVAISMFGSTVINRVTTVMFVHIVLVLGLQMFMGNSGILSFAHVGFMAIGAYASALMSIPAENKGRSLPNLYEPLMGVELGFLPAILVGAIAAAAFAAITGVALMRLSDTAAAISSFALLVIVNVVLSQWNEVTNGPRTLAGVLKYTDLWTAFGWAVIVVILAFLFKESALGMKLRASRDNMHAADAIGINVVKTRWIAFVLSAFVAGLAGGLWAHFITSFQPDALYFKMTFLVLMMLVVGGPQTISGATLGVIVITIIYEGLRSVENNLALSGALPFKTVGMTEIVLAVALIVMLALRPGGIIHTVELGGGVRRRREQKPSASA